MGIANNEPWWTYGSFHIRPDSRWKIQTSTCYVAIIMHQSCPMQMTNTPIEREHLVILTDKRILWSCLYMMIDIDDKFGLSFETFSSEFSPATNHRELEQSCGTFQSSQNENTDKKIYNQYFHSINIWVIEIVEYWLILAIFDKFLSR